MRSGDRGSEQHGSDGRGAALVAGLRAHSLAGFTHQAEHLRRMWMITRLVHAQEGWRIGEGSRADALGCGRITEHDLDVLAAAEVAAATGSSQFEAERDVVVARALCTVLTATLGALAAGRVDARRARVLAEETAGLTDRQARKVEATVLDGLPALPLDGTDRVGPWGGPTPAAFTRRVKTAVAKARTDVEDHVRREVRERTGIQTWTHPENPTLSTMTVTGPTELVLTVAAGLDAFSRGLTRDELGGRTRGMAELDLLFDAVCDDGTDSNGLGGDGGRAGGRVQREIGVVITLDTLTSEDPASHSTGEVRGNGTPVPVTAAVARVVAGQALDRGASTCVLLTDTCGHLTRLLRIGQAPGKGWTRSTLLDVTRRARQKHPEPRHHADAYTPTVEIADFVAARDPVCTFPGCAVPTSRCDLDHTIPHPRGPTSVPNLSPRSRRCHRYKTAALWHCRTLTDDTRTVTAHEWTSPLGTRQVVEVEPLPGR